LQNLLAQLYNGQLNPNEHAVPEDPQYREIGQKISIAMDKWNHKHSEEERKELEAIFDWIDQTHEKELFSTFSYGFRLGAGLMVEALTGKSGLANKLSAFPDTNP
jgi:hypothetical protein